MGITIVWFELEPGTVARWRDDPAAAVASLTRAWGAVLDAGDDDVPMSPPIRRVAHFDYKASVATADDHSAEAGDLVADAIQGNEPLPIGHWPEGSVRAYTRSHVVSALAALPDDPTHPGHHLRALLAEIHARGSELVSLWT